VNRRIHDRKCRDRYREELNLARLYRDKGTGITHAARWIGIDARTIKHYLPDGWRDARHDNRGPARDINKRCKIKFLRRNNHSVAEIAAEMGVSRQRVYQILAEEK
jgi:predicted DNA-binding protein (UPF0251 family)